MPRVKGGPRGHRRKRRIIELAKGYRGTRSKLFKRAHEAVVRAGEHAFKGRKKRRRDLRRLWIARINSALSTFNIKYSRFIDLLKKHKIELNRKMLSEIAIRDHRSFEEIVKKVSSN